MKHFSRSHRPRWECILQYDMKAKYSSKSNYRMHSHAGAWERGQLSKRTEI